METWQSWTIFGLATAGAAYYYTLSSDYKKRGNTIWKSELARTFTSESKAVGNKESRKRDKSSAKSEKDTIHHSKGLSSTTGAEAGRDKKARRGKKLAGDKQSAQKTSSTEIPSARVSQYSDVEEREEIEGDMSNEEFARQFNQCITGSKLERKSDKSTKAGRQQLGPKQTGVMTTDGFEAVRNSKTEQVRGGNRENHVAFANDVTDMLEPPQKAASVLRVTQSEKSSAQSSTPKTPTSQPALESKKQRQNKRRKEEQKALVEAAEKERLGLMEKQRRAAREAEGRPAKDGQAFMAAQRDAKAASQNVWTSDTNFKEGAHNLLDTFDPSATDAAPQASQISSSRQPNGFASHNQVDGEWSTVSKSGKAKSKSATSANPLKEADDRTMSEVNSSYGHGTISPHITPVSSTLNGKFGSSAMIKGEERKKVKAADPSIWNHSNISEHPEYNSAYPYALIGHPEDSDWAVV